MSIPNRDNGKENGNHYLGSRVILGLHRGNGKENGNYYSGLYGGLLNTMEDQMENPKP